MKTFTQAKILLGIILVAAFAACGGDSGEATSNGGDTKAPEKEVAGNTGMDNVGVGPISSLTLPSEIDTAMVSKGAAIYEEMCTACHKVDRKHIGPPPTGILERRNPAWVMNMILNPEEMVQKDVDAKKLFIEYNASPMSNQGLTEDEARAILEFFRTL